MNDRQLFPHACMLAFSLAFSLARYQQSAPASFPQRSRSEQQYSVAKNFSLCFPNVN